MLIIINKTDIAIWLQVSQDGNMTSSILSFQPTLSHHDKVITCRAENPKVQRGIVEDTWKLNVFCKSSLIYNRYKIKLHTNDQPNHHSICVGRLEAEFVCRVWSWAKGKYNFILFGRDFQLELWWLDKENDIHYINYYKQILSSI